MYSKYWCYNTYKLLTFWKTTETNKKSVNLEYFNLLRANFIDLSVKSTLHVSVEYTQYERHTGIETRPPQEGHE